MVSRFGSGFVIRPVERCRETVKAIELLALMILGENWWEGIPIGSVTVKLRSRRCESRGRWSQV